MLNQSLGDSTQLTVWSVGEINVGIVCACMPALKPLFKRFLEKTGLTTGSRGNKNSSGSGGHNASNSHRLSNLPKGVVTSGSRRGHARMTSSSNESEETIIQQNRGIPMIREESLGRKSLEWQELVSQAGRAMAHMGCFFFFFYWSTCVSWSPHVSGCSRW